MFDNINTIIAGFTGKLKSEPTLRKWFWVFVSAIAFTLIVLGYNAFMSLNFYRQMLDRFADMEGDFLPYLVTVAIALIAFFLIASITATILDYIAKRKYKTDGHEPMFISAIIGLVALLCLDIYANLQGVDFVAYDTTEQVMENPLDNIEAEYEVRRENAEKEYQPKIKKHENVIAQIRDLSKASISGHNRKCKTICPYKIGTGSVHWDGQITRFGHGLIAEYQSKIDNLESEYNAELAAIRQGETTKRETAKDDYNRDKSRFDISVDTKQSGHRKLVYFAYAIAILLSFVTNHYSDRAEMAIHPDREAQLIAAYETRKDRQEAMTAARRAQYQYGNEETKKILAEVLASIETKSSDMGSKPIGYSHKGDVESSAELNRLKRELEELKRSINSQGEKGEIRGVSSQGESSTHTHEKTREIHLNNSHPKFSNRVQPDQYKGIDEKRYKKFVNVAKSVLDEKGRYVKAEIQRRTKFDKNTVNKYLKLAIEVRNDLTA